MSETFTPTDETRAILRNLAAGLADEAEAKFFDVWESEISDPDAPRIAGSIIANAYMRNAARFGVFGAQCAGKEPSLKLWLAIAEEQFNDALQACAKANEIAVSSRESPQETTVEADHG